MHVLNDQYARCVGNFQKKALAWVSFLVAVKKFLKDLFSGGAGSGPKVAA